MGEPDIRLSRAEMRNLTGTPIKSRQVAFLLRNGIAHYTDLGGWPVVLRATVERTDTSTPEAEWRPRKAG